MSHVLSQTFKDQFLSTLKLMGIPVIYTRSDRRFVCRECSGPDEDGGRADCANCFGTGFNVTLERWFVGYSNTLARLSTPQVPLSRDGYTNDNNAFIFSRPEDQPVAMDRFFVVEWDKKRDDVFRLAAQPLRIIQAYMVLYAEANIGGEVIYHTSHCDFVTESKAQYERALLRTPVNVSRTVKL
jgi:hypothetical protein